MLTISLFQMDIRFGDLDANRQAAEAMIAEAARRGSQLVLLPELWGSGYDLRRAAQLAAPLHEGLFAWTAAQARSRQIAIAGSLLERQGERCYNTLALYDASGTLLAAYRKAHLFGMMGEPAYLRAGDALVTAAAAWGRTGLSICYDLRFPEVYRRAALDEATLMLVPAEFPQARIAHWSLLLRARAVENLLFVAGCNRCGSDPGEAYGGRSAVIDPWGNALAEAGADETLLTIEIDLNESIRARRRLPVLDDRRSDLYD
jgi:predicted amidohydrolase